MKCTSAKGIVCTNLVARSMYFDFNTNAKYEEMKMNEFECVLLCRKYVIYCSGASNALERRCQYKCFAFVYPYASVKNMGSAAAVLFLGKRVAQCLNWTDAKVR